MSSFSAHTRTTNKRAYRLGKRAEQQDGTRRRIVEAAVELHCTIGPAHTTVSQIAERAGVQRHTYYAHFPDERSLFLACSGMAMERDPLPDVEPLGALPPRRERIRRGLELFYQWFVRNEDHAGCVIRDAEHHALTREMVELRIAPIFRRAADVLAEGLNDRSRALLGMALDFACWRNLSRTYNPADGAELMSDAVVRVA